MAYDSEGGEPSIETILYTICSLFAICSFGGRVLAPFDRQWSLLNFSGPLSRCAKEPQRPARSFLANATTRGDGHASRCAVGTSRTARHWRRRLPACEVISLVSAPS